MENKAELKFIEFMEKLNIKVKKISWLGYPDFQVLENLWVEVKNENTQNGKKLSSKQIKTFNKLIKEDNNIWIALFRKDNTFEFHEYDPTTKDDNMKTIRILLDDDEFERLSLKKGDKTWREYLLDMEVLE